jgi:hypothetical protein
MIEGCPFGITEDNVGLFAGLSEEVGFKELLEACEAFEFQEGIRQISCDLGVLRFLVLLFLDFALLKSAIHFLNENFRCKSRPFEDCLRKRRIWNGRFVIVFESDVYFLRLNNTIVVAVNISMGRTVMEKAVNN